MKALQKNDPETWQARKSGDFAGKKSGIPITNLFVDQNLEQKSDQVLHSSILPWRKGFTINWPSMILFNPKVDTVKVENHEKLEQQNGE